jgi:hypothetical protein
MNGVLNLLAEIRANRPKWMSRLRINPGREWVDLYGI